MNEHLNCTFICERVIKFTFNHFLAHSAAMWPVWNPGQIPDPSNLFICLIQKTVKLTYWRYLNFGNIKEKEKIYVGVMGSAYLILV